METKKDDEPDEVNVDETSFEAYGGSSGNQSANDQDDDDVDDENDEDDDDEDVETHLPAISPISNVSSSSGFFSCGSASSSSFASKPTTPTNLHLLTDKSDDDYHSPIKSKNDRDNILDFGKLPISKKRDNEENNSDNQYNRQTASTSKSVKIRSKHHRQSRKHISLEDEIVIYESDSSLQVASDSRRRTVHMIQKSFHANQLSTKSSASRRRSEENSSSSTHHIVSILKRKDSSTSSNAGLVTFSPNVVDTNETRSRHRTGILKKRSSLDESSRYRSHSPSSASSESEKGCLVRGHRRNSFEEISHHGILKQKSYDSSGGGSSAFCGSSGGYNTPNSCASSSSSNVQGILKKKPSLTPSDDPNDHLHHHHQPTKHVSISEAVILAAAELCKDMIILDDSQCESYIKPILKVDNDHNNYQERKPKPILKKNHSSENEEIRSILKSRKCSREESSSQDDL
jgi:hypothetical protein